MPRARRWEALAAALAAVFVVVALLVWGGSALPPDHESEPSSGSGHARLSPSDRPPSATSAIATDLTTPNAARPGARTQPSPGRATTEVGGAGPALASRSDRPPTRLSTGIIRGRVELSDGTPLANEGVFVRRLDDEFYGRNVRTDAFGKFTAEVNGSVWYQVWALGGLRGDQNLSHSKRRIFVPSGRSPVQVVLTLAPTPTLRFVPGPRPGDRVLLRRARPSDRFLPATLPKPLKADGVFPRLEPAPYDVTYFANGGRTSHHRIALQPGENVVNLSLKGPGRVVLDARGANDERVEVRVRFKPLDRTVLYRAIGTQVAMRRIERVEFTVRRERELDIPAGRYLLTTLSSPAGLDTPSTEITVTPEQRLVVPLRLRPATSVEVQLDRPWPTGGVKVLGKPGWSVEAPAKRGDPFRILRIATADTGTILVRLGDLVGEARISAGMRPFLRLAPCGSVRLQVKRGGHDDSAKTFVTFTTLRPLVELVPWRPGVRTGPPTVPTRTDADGRVIQKLSPGRWRIEAEGESIEVTVPTRITVDATLPLK